MNYFNKAKLAYNGFAKNKFQIISCLVGSREEDQLSTCLLPQFWTCSLVDGSAMTVVIKPSQFALPLSQKFYILAVINQHRCNHEPQQWNFKNSLCTDTRITGLIKGHSSHHKFIRNIFFSLDGISYWQK